MNAWHVVLVSSCLPAVALARPPGVEPGTQGGFVWYFGLAVITALVLLWFWQSLKERGPPPLDPRNRT